MSSERIYSYACFKKHCFLSRRIWYLRHLITLIFTTIARKICPKVKNKILQGRQRIYQSSLINALEEDNVKWSITADMDSSVKKAIKSIKEWIRLEGLGLEIAETIHCTNKTDNAFRLIIKREYRKQPDLFEGQYFYHAVATNLEGTPLEILNRHNKRGQAENFNKEIKNGFSMENIFFCKKNMFFKAQKNISCGTFCANAVYFGIGILSYNLLYGFKLLNPEFLKHTIKTFRWKFINIAGRIIKHSGKIILKIKMDLDKYIALLHLRQKIFYA